MDTKNLTELVAMQHIVQQIFVLRGHKVMLDADLARLYGVQTKILNKAVHRNFKRFPDDFMFQLTPEEFVSLRFHFGTSNRGGRRYLPLAFTEQGVAMLSSVLRSERAVLVNVAIMRIFVKLRQISGTRKDFARKLEELEKKYKIHDVKLQEVFDAIRQLMMPPEPKSQRRLGFRQL